jgi:hypothetical protein
MIVYPRNYSVQTESTASVSTTKVSTATLSESLTLAAFAVLSPQDASAIIADDTNKNVNFFIVF